MPRPSNNTTTTAYHFAQNDPDDVPVAMAEAVASLQPSLSTSNVVSELAEYLLENQGFPKGLALELGNSKAIYPLRFWIVDNSGSMMTKDGRELTGNTKDSLVVSDCTRWHELCGTVEYHIWLANVLGAHTIFRLLNPPKPSSSTTGTSSSTLPQEFSIADHGEPSDQTTIANALGIVRSTVPAGVTPLTMHLQAITARIAHVAPMLRDQSQKAVVVIATDGLPTDPMGNVNDNVKQEFMQALKTLQAQPVWIVIRLCTQNPTVVDFYNQVDQQLEAKLEVVDDFFGEAKEVTKHNKWLNYTLPLHRCREMGYHHRVFDLLDEDTLNHDQLRSFVQFLFGQEFADPLTDWKEFINQIESINETVGKEWNCNTGKLSYWFDKKELTKKFGPKRGFLGF